VEFAIGLVAILPLIVGITAAFRMKETLVTH
jgi:hypothetical protein